MAHSSSESGDTTSSAVLRTPEPSVFGPTGFGQFQPSGEGASWKDGLTGRSQVFDVCHVGVVLRLIFAMYIILGLSAAYDTHTPLDWLMRVAWSSVIAFPAVLIGLAMACGAKVWLAKQSSLTQWVSVILIGVVSALASGWPMSWAMEGLYNGPSFLALALTGAISAAAVYQWLVWRVRLERPATDSARLIELQSRIRPHFLFNTLNTAIALVRLDPERAEAVLEDLAELFRVALADGNAMVTLGQEVELAKRYLEIEQIRFGARLRVEWDIDEGGDAARVPPLLLQPLVENAVKHGVESSPTGGWVKVSTKVRGALVLVSVHNSVPEGEPRATSGHGIALRNVRERLFLMHDVAAQFEVQHKASSYRVRMAIPLSQ